MQYQQQRGRYLPQREQKLPSLSPDYLKNLEGGYFDEGKNIKCDLLTQMAERVARDLGNSGLTSAQLRRFFAQVRSIERELGPENFPEIVPKIQSLEPMAANYVGRGSNRQEREKREIFKQFIDCNVALATKDKDSFKKGFVPHFESVVAYYKYHFPNR